MYLVFFSWFRLGLWVWGRGPQRESETLITSHQGSTPCAHLITLHTNLGHLAEVVFVMFLCWQLLFFLLSIMLFGRKSPYPTHAWGVGGFILLPWGQSVSINYLESFCTGDLSAVPHFFIYYFLIFIRSHGYLYYTSSHNLLLLQFALQLTPALVIGSSYIWFLHPFDISHCCWVWVFSSLSARQDTLSSSDVFSHPRISHFFRERRFLSLEGSIWARGDHTCLVSPSTPHTCSHQSWNKMVDLPMTSWPPNSRGTPSVYDITVWHAS